jgi:hypothetical protein
MVVALAKRVHAQGLDWGHLIGAILMTSPFSRSGIDDYFCNVSFAPIFCFTKCWRRYIRRGGSSQNQVRKVGLLRPKS